MTKFAALVSVQNRIASIGVLRGFALFGILIINIQSSSMVEAAYFDPSQYDNADGGVYDGNATVSQSGTGGKSEITQFGGRSATAKSTQSGLENVSIINQEDGYQNAIVLQEGTRGVSTIDQIANRPAGVWQNTARATTLATGIDTLSTITQNGYFGFASVEQSGYNTTSTIFQSGHNADARVEQTLGTNNQVDISQTALSGGLGVTATVYQNFGSDLVVSVTQVGKENSTEITQSGKNNTAYVYQVATNNNSICITQSGFFNTSTVNQ
ncbi:MAG: hypothetical protein P8N30_04400 [Tateyamaria sp.]|nr:hypothetical protein [Tateyamaria sp.]MDG1335279.1 hypothetical protein [Tateyamaria sp.]MDG2057164.1 hypothetical protein [Tateyamaria sp.]